MSSPRAVRLLASAGKATNVVAAHNNNSRAMLLSSRSFASLPAVSDPSAKPTEVIPEARSASAPAVAAPESSAAAASAPPKKSGSGSVWQRFTAFLTGVGVSSAYFFYSLSDDLERTNASVGSSLAAFRREAVTANTEMRTRLATLEHQVAELQASARN